MINIQFQLSGLVILCIITLFYFRTKRIDLKTQAVFRRLLLASDICASLDICSVFMIYNRNSLPDVAVEGVCKAYLCMLVIVSYLGLLYICSDIYVKDSDFTRVRITYRMIVMTSCCMVFLMPIRYFEAYKGQVIYSYGPATVVTYVTFAVIFIAMLIHLAVGRRKINPRRRNAVYTWLIIWSVAAILQFRNSRFLLVTYACVVGVLIIFIIVENPESNMDKRSGIFNISALQQYAYNAYANNRVFSMLVFCVYGNVRVEEIPAGQADMFIGGGVIYLMYEKKEDMEAALKQIEEKFPRQKVFVIPNSLVVPDTEELFAMIRTFKLVNGREDKEHICYVDQSYVQKLVEQHEIELVLQDAMKNDRVEVFYQPIFSTVKKRFVSAEALVRIRDKNGDLVSPAKFIPVAEEYGYIVELGKIILDKVFQFLKNHQQSLGLEYVEVNLSVIQGEDKRLAEDVLSLLDKYKLNPESVVLEITETASVQGKEQLLHTMKLLLSRGIQFALDDFGTGQSNLDYMASMPVGIVKFDKNMTADYFAVSKTKTIMNAAINLVHDMGMEIVAEGIETREQLDEMIKQGVEHIQGYYFSRPLSEGDFIQYMQSSEDVFREFTV